jgi:hypothetical protein
VPNDVQLPRFDVSQLGEGYVAKPPEARLRSLSVKLLADLKAAHERLDSESEQQFPSPEQPRAAGGRGSW